MIEVTGSPVSRKEFEDLKALLYQHDGALRCLSPQPKVPANDLDLFMFLGVLLAISYVAYRYPGALAGRE